MKRIKIRQLNEENLKGFSESLYATVRKSLHLVRRSKRGTIGLLILVLFAIMGTIGPLVMPYDPRININLSFKPPTLVPFEPFGRDYFGRDIFALVVYGSRSVLTISVMAAAIIVGVGVSIGLLSGFLGGWVDHAFMFAADIALTIPSVPLMVVIAMSLGPGSIKDPITMAMILSITSWAGLSRAIRSQVFSLKETAYIEAAKVLGLSNLHIVFREMMPIIMPYIAVSFLYTITGTIYASVGLFFLGVVRFDPSNWGVMINQSMQWGVYNPLGRAQLMGPLLAIMALQIGMILFCSGLEEVFNPRLREEE